ncbi:MAG: hypothetical protein ABS75_07315 [Pelagibacterium sp. SCN 63-23]|nr:MAG: hypothetical protein ABS75_07315 [Pelagibacterium sp. SCN 63-23]
MTSALSLDKIKTDGGTQSRSAINPEVVEEYAAIIRDGADFPPVTVFYDGKRYWLADGFHRLEAYRKAGALEIPAAVHQGTNREAVLFSVGANASHGLRRTNEDKRRAVMVLLGDNEWSQWSDREIARQCGVGRDLVGDVRRMVAGVRRSLSATDSEPRTYTTRHGTIATMDTARIGKSDQDFDQAEDDRQRSEVAKNLPPEIQAHEAAKAARRAGGAATEVWTDADDIAELRAIVAQQTEEISDLRRTVAKYDNMAVEFEKGGFENVIAGLEQRIETLSRQVERESQEKVTNLRKAEYWKRKAQEAGATGDYRVDMETGELSRG